MTLLVLDNFERVAAAAPLVADLLRAAPGLKVLVTSRAALRVYGEQEYPVPGLPAPPDRSQRSGLDRFNVPGEERAFDVEAVGHYAAVRLFIERAVAVRPGFAVTNENAPAVAAICARLHGMPLAIELAAARVKLLGPDAILARLENQLEALASGSRDLPERQQTLRGAIAWSYDLLDAGPRRLLDRVSVFAGSFDLDAAEAIAGPPGDIGGDVLDGLIEPRRSEPREGQFDARWGAALPAARVRSASSPPNSSAAAVNAISCCRVIATGSPPVAARGGSRTLGR